MQFHLNGFRPGDPALADSAPHHAASPDRRPADTLPAELDVLIVGTGPAGLTLAAQLAAFPDIATAIVEQRPGPLLVGQADGIACRTMEMFEAFGFSQRVLREAYWVNETCFWKPADGRADAIVPAGKIQDTEDGLSEFPHVILNQARIQDYYLEAMRQAPTRLEPRYGRAFVGMQKAPDGQPLTVRLERTDGAAETVRARYVVGCDGARSAVRRALGHALQGDSANQAWGVMDILATTDFPDIRLKSVIHSGSDGSMIIIPREGGYLVRCYIELDKLRDGERIAERNVTIDRLIETAGRILRPYALDVKEVAWWSVYEIGQRLCDHFDDAPPAADGRTPRVFIAGDACHTHSPKAGQGMNVSMQDGFNLGWKLAAVLRGQSAPALLATYSAERQAVAQVLIDFDRAFAAMLTAASKRDGVDPADFQDHFVKQGRFTAGTATHYQPSIISAEPRHQALAAGFLVGMRFHSAPVIRLADARPIQLGHTIKADGRWRLFLFADAAAAKLRTLCGQLEPGLVRRYTPAGADPDSVFDIRAVLQQSHRDVSVAALPDLLLPRKGKFGLIDYEKAFCPDPAADIFDRRSIDRSGCIVVVRPDQYVANVLPLDRYDELAAFFDAFMLASAPAGA